MEIRNKLRGLIESLSAEQVAILAEEVAAYQAEAPALQAARPIGVMLEEITVAKMQDPAFAAKVREEVNAALRGER